MVDNKYLKNTILSHSFKGSDIFISVEIVSPELKPLNYLDGWENMKNIIFALEALPKFPIKVMHTYGTYINYFPSLFA